MSDEISKVHKDNPCPGGCWAFKELINSGVVEESKDINGNSLNRWSFRTSALPNIIPYCPFCGSKLLTPLELKIKANKSYKKIAMRLVKEIEKDLNVRKGLHLDECESIVRYDIRHTWLDIINQYLEELTRGR